MDLKAKTKQNQHGLKLNLRKGIMLRFLGF